MVVLGKLCSKLAAAASRLCASDDVQAAGSVLDRVISQASSEDNTTLYKIADYKKGGRLIEAYTKGGATAAERLIKNEFPMYMYAGGRGCMINRAEYLRWKFRDQEHVVLPIEASLSPHDPLAKWRDHEACWQMKYRGALGESLLQLLIICDTKIHTRLARILLKCFPKLAVDFIEGEEYLGAGSLHMAIAYSNNELVQELVEAGADVSQRAIGSFFLPRDQQRTPPSRHTDYEGLAYLGEYPLAWAACCANESVYNMLLDNGADPDAQDSFGNMILHMVVVCDKLDMFGYALRHPKVPATNGMVNSAGLTPLTLACQLGRAEVFREMLELSAREFWRYSNITCSAYPLNALDTLLPDGKTNWNSALFIILNGTKEEHLDMLDGGIIQRLLEEKWKTFARKQFLKRLLILMLHLLLLSIAIYMRPSADEPVEPTARSYIRMLCEIGTLISTASYIIFQQGDELNNQGFVAFFKQLGSEPAKAIFLASNFLLLACIPARLAGNTRIEEAILLFAVPGSWFLLMFFAGAVRLTGPFVTMIYSMITGDMLTFGIIYCIVLFGFSQSFYFLYRGFPNVKTSLYNSYPSTWMAMFQITLGDYSYTDLSLTTYPALAKSVFALFMVFVPILLLNMLIAMMGNTYAHVIEQSEKEWMKQWAKIVVSVERAVPSSDAARYLQEYSIALGPSENPRLEQRAVMVIKSKDKTRAKQRKGALANWKRVGKVTITELRRRGISGEELRRLMWGRTSISTPTKLPHKLKPSETAVGIGTALSSTLDVLTYTQELDPNTVTGGGTVSTNLAVSTAASPNILVQVNGRALSSNTVTTTNTIELPTSQSVNTVVPTYEQLMKSTQVLPTTEQEGQMLYPDYLRMMVCERSRVDSVDKQVLNQYVTSLHSTPIANIVTKPSKVNARAVIAGAVSGLFSVTGGTGKQHVSSAGDTSWKRPQTHEHSDLETDAPAVMLGRVARMRRARSAWKSTRQVAKWMWRGDSSSETAPDEPPELEYADERIKNLQESTDHIYRNPSDANQIGRRESNEDLQPITTLSGLVTGPGNGAEQLCPAPATTLQQKSISKSHRPRRTNRVSPFRPWASNSVVCLDAILYSDSTSNTSYSVSSDNNNDD